MSKDALKQTAAAVGLTILYGLTISQANAFFWSHFLVESYYTKERRCKSSLFFYARYCSLYLINKQLYF